MKEPLHHHGRPAPLATSLSLLLPLAVVVAFLLLVVGLAVGFARWCLLEEAGSQWLVQRLPLVKVQGFRGALLAPQWQAERVQLTWDQGRASLTIEGLSAQGLRWRWRPDDHAWLALDAEQIAATKLTLKLGPPRTADLPKPRDLQLPLHLNAQVVRVEQLLIDGLAPITQLQAQGVVLRADPGAEHRITSASALWQGVLAEAGASVGTSGPMLLQLQGSLRPQLEGDAPRWAAVLSARGPFDQPAVLANLRGVPRSGMAPPALDLSATLRPLALWPMSRLDAATQELDLSALSLRAPQTRLNGKAQLTARERNAPLAANIELDNSLPGRWNEGRLPLAKLSAELRGDLNRLDRLEAPRFEAQLADGSKSAGRLGGKLLWQGHELTVEADLQELTPQRLDGRAAAMRLSGPVAATLRGLPSPDGKSPPAPAAPSVSWKLELQGALDASPQPVRLAMEGNANDQRLELSALRASSGAASADMKALFQRSGKTDWKLETSGSLVDFDPLPWWPGEPGGAWRQGPHRLSAGWQLDLRVPGNAASLPTLTLLQRLAGSGNLRMHDSMLAGVPLSADIKIGYVPGGTPATVQLRAEALLGGNQLSAEGRADPAGNGQADRWRAELKADSLATLAPLTKLHPALAEWVPRQGSVSATLEADGRWPQLRSQGQAKLSQLAVGRLSLAQGQASWRLDSSGDKSLQARVTLSGLQLGAGSGAQKADNLTAELSGTLQEHRIDINAALPLQPPAAAVQLLGVRAQSGTRAQMAAVGQWRAEPGGGGHWDARVQRLLLGSWDGGAAEAPPNSLWMQARDLRTQLLFGPAGQLLTLHADAGRVQLGDSVALRWDDITADWRGALPSFELRADIEPFTLAPLLARLQPRMGWAGDLRVAARVNLRAAEKMEGEVVLLRQDGDLHIASDEGTQLMGLTDAQLAVTVRDGNWAFVPVFKGRSLGEITGEVRAKTTPERRWPHADAVLDGEVQAHVADLGVWANWVPAGWRLGGELRTSAGLSGRFGAPQYSGELSGKGLALRNLLQGVNVSDGVVQARLEGDLIKIERFRVKGGDGFVDVAGEGRIVSLTQPPEARLQVSAERFRVLGRVDRLVTTSGKAEFDFKGDQISLNGRLVLDEALFDIGSADAPTLDSDVTLRQPGQADEDTQIAKEKQPAPKRNFALDLEIDAGQNTQLRGRGIDTGLQGKLRFSAPGGRLAIRGTVNSDEGSYKAYGQKLRIERGIVAFGGPPDDPRLDILAVRPDIDTRVGVAITGTALTPRVRLFSEPEMSESDKLSWLLLGRASDGLGRNDTALLQRAAIALLAGEGEAPTDTLLRNLGIDEISLKQSDGEVRETVISLGKQLSRRWYVGYERGVNSTAGTWQLIYRIAQRFTLRAQSGQENSLDAIWTWRFQETPADAGNRRTTIKPRSN
jgi:translocation and assembly module TamB